MNIFSSLISALIGAVIGYFFNELIDFLKKRKEQNISDRNNKELLNCLSSQEYSRLENGMVQVAHGSPMYKPEDLTGAIIDNNYFYPIPPKFKKALSDNGFTQKDSEDFKYRKEDNCLSDDFWGKSEFDRGISSIMDSDWEKAKTEIKNAANEVANILLSDIQAGKVRFNGPMFGVASFNPNRSIGEERPTSMIRFYKTDYFSYLVFSKFYEQHPLTKERITNDIINNLSYPFLSSFGVAVIAILSTNKITDPFVDSDVIVIGRRSQNVYVDPGKLHFTMNEAFSLRDTDHGVPSFGLCATRGFNEELRWSNAHIPGVDSTNIKFTDFFFNSIDCEMGLTGYMKISTIDGKEINEMKTLLDDLYRESQDGALETDGFEYITIGEAKAYLEKNKEKMSAGFATELNNFLRRYKYHML